MTTLARIGVRWGMAGIGSGGDDLRTCNMMVARRLSDHMWPRWRGDSILNFAPSLEHQHAPQVGVPFALAAEEFAPDGADRCRVEVAFLAQTALIELGLGPVAQWSAQPV